MISRLFIRNGNGNIYGKLKCYYFSSDIKFKILNLIFLYILFFAFAQKISQTQSK